MNHSLVLSSQDLAMLNGEDGPANAFAMRLLVGLAQAAGSRRLIDISSAHLDSALCQGQVSLDFAQRLRDLGGRVRVPTTLNVGAVDLIHPGLARGDPHTQQMGRDTMQAFTDMGGAPTWTCAPYQLPGRPGLGECVAWGESNAIVFANSVLGARTPRFGDFVDVCAALTGRAPEMSLYLTENRRATVQYHVAGFSARARASEEFFAVLGFYIGADADLEVPVITGIEQASEDQLKVMGAAAASSGTVGMFHMVGVTPEAPTLAAATQDAAARLVQVTPAGLEQARSRLSTREGGPLQAVNLGTPHYSVGQIARLWELLDGRPVHEMVSLYVNTSRDVLAQVPQVAAMEALGVVFVVDTCTYVTAILDETVQTAMCDSAKWAYYAPGNLKIEVVFGSVEECVESATAGRIIRSEHPWT